MILWNGSPDMWDLTGTGILSVRLLLCGCQGGYVGLLLHSLVILASSAVEGIQLDPGEQMRSIIY